MLSLRADNIEFVMVAGRGMRHEQFPITLAAHAHRMPPRIPEVEVADHADPPRVRREHDERDAGDAVQRHRMRAELVVQPLLRAFTEQIEIELGQNRRKAVGVVEFDRPVAKTRAQLVTLRSIRQGACEQSGIVDAGQRRRFAVLADGVDIGRLRQERPHDGFVVLLVQAEVMKRIGMAAFHDGIGLCGQFRHEASICCDRIRSAPVSGTRSQSGRCASSYSIS